MDHFDEIDFPVRSWDVHSSSCFQKTNEKWGAFSNMAAGFPIVINDVQWRTSEALYQALRFPDFPDVQELIRMEKSPMAAKMVSKPHRSKSSRTDWEDVRIDLMYWSLRVKLAYNFHNFGGLLRESMGTEIVEKSSKDRFWGAVPVNKDYLQGRNVLGVLLAKLGRDWVLGQESPCMVEPPNISNCLLLGKVISPIEPPEFVRDTLF